MNGLSSLDETFREYLLDHADDLVKFWRSKVNVTVGHQNGERICVDSVHILVRSDAISELPALFPHQQFEHIEGT